MLLCLKKLFEKFSLILSLRKISCRIVKIDSYTQEVIFHIKNKALYIKCSLSEAISDISTIEKLTPEQACQLGGYYGKSLRAHLNGKEALKKAAKMKFLITKSQGRQTIIFQNRSGEIGYLDRKTNENFIEHPLTIATNKYSISKFNSTQACYIGILAGIDFEKLTTLDNRKDRIERKNPFRAKPKLRIVK